MFAQEPKPNRRKDSARIRREKRTVLAMVRIFCHSTHATRGGLCSSCRDLLRYAFFRLERCPFGPDKPTCANCPVHCYRPDMRERIRAVMRYAGPRMLFRRPWLALMHLLDGWKKAPKRPDRQVSM